MPELIDRAKVLEYLTTRIKTETPYGEGYNRALEDAAELVNLMPTIDAQPVRHGRWELKMLPFGGGDKVRAYLCTECDRYANMKFDFCPNCGAKMDGGSENDD